MFIALFELRVKASYNPLMKIAKEKKVHVNPTGIIESTPLNPTPSLFEPGLAPSVMIPLLPSQTEVLVDAATILPILIIISMSPSPHSNGIDHSHSRILRITRHTSQNAQTLHELARIIREQLRRGRSSASRSVDGVKHEILAGIEILVCDPLSGLDSRVRVHGVSRRFG
jgi:hypothetical protein